MRKFLLSIITVFILCSLVAPQGVIKLQWQNLTGCCVPHTPSATDNFNRADSLTNLNPPSDGIHTWTIQRGTFGISSNQAYASAAPSGFAIATINFGSPEATIRAKWYHFHNAEIGNVPISVGIIFNFIDVNNYQILFYTPVFNEFRYNDVVGGGLADSNLINFPVNDGDEVKVITTCNQYAFYVNDVLFFGPFLHIGGQLSNNHGIVQDVNAITGPYPARIDDFSITSCTAF